MSRAPRVSTEQRYMILEFMLRHEDLGRGRISGPDAARTKKRLLSKMAESLNSVGSGATKTPEKWFKVWHDWKSDIKAKAQKIKRVRCGTGGGGSTVPLTPMEQQVLNFFAPEMMQGLEGVLDPLEILGNTITITTEQSSRGGTESEAEPGSVHSDRTPEPSRQRSRRDPTLEILQAQVDAIQNVASAIREIAPALHAIAHAMQPEILELSENEDVKHG